MTFRNSDNMNTPTWELQLLITASGLYLYDDGKIQISYASFIHISTGTPKKRYIVKIDWATASLFRIWLSSSLGKAVLTELSFRRVVRTPTTQNYRTNKRRTRQSEKFITWKEFFIPYDFRGQKFESILSVGASSMELSRLDCFSNILLSCSWAEHGFSK